MNILHIGPTVTRVKNYLTITTNKELVFHNVNKTYKRIMDGELVIDPSPGEKIYDEMLSSLKSKDDAYYFDAGGRYSSSSNIKKHNIAFTIIRSILGTTKLFYTSRISDREKKKRFKNNSIEIKPTISLRNLPYRYYYDLYKRLQEQKLSKETFYGKYDPDEKYLFFPLHSAPEYALQQQANMWNDQLHIIDALAKSIPFDWKVYVKEHPANVIYRVRLSSFYRKIKTYANVKLIPTYLDTNMIIRNSQFVAHICGTAGWEAVLFHGKPTINFHEMFHDVTGLSKKVENLVELSREIHNEVKRIKKIDSDERKKRIICLINALCIHSISVDNPVATMGASQFYLSEEELKSAGVSFGDAVIQFIEETKSNCAKVQSSN